MQPAFSRKLEKLGFERPDWCLPCTEAMVRTFEEQFSLTLPPDYREFLVRQGGLVGNALCPFLEPTPCGGRAVVDFLYGFTSPERDDNVIASTALIDGAPDVITIGDSLMGDMLWLKCSGDDFGHVYMYDHERRFDWPDAWFYSQFPNMHPEVKRFLVLRAEGRLPKKPKGYEHVYRVAKSFTEFVDRLEQAED